MPLIRLNDDVYARLLKIKESCPKSWRYFSWNDFLEIVTKALERQCNFPTEGECNNLPGKKLQKISRLKI